MEPSQIRKHIFTWLTKGQKSTHNDVYYEDVSAQLGHIIYKLNKRERHALYMALKGIKR